MWTNVNVAVCPSGPLASHYDSRLQTQSAAEKGDHAPAIAGAEGCTKNVPDALQIQ